jgi:hypothetical protein
MDLDAAVPIDQDVLSFFFRVAHAPALPVKIQRASKKYVLMATVSLLHNVFFRCWWGAGLNKRRKPVLEMEIRSSLTDRVLSALHSARTLKHLFCIEDQNRRMASSRVSGATARVDRSGVPYITGCVMSLNLRD